MNTPTRAEDEVTELAYSPMLRFLERQRPFRAPGFDLLAVNSGVHWERCQARYGPVAHMPAVWREVYREMAVEKLAAHWRAAGDESASDHDTSPFR